MCFTCFSGKPRRVCADVVPGKASSHWIQATFTIYPPKFLLQKTLGL